MSFEGRKYPTNKEKFNIHGSAVLVKTEKGTFLFQLKDEGAPSGDANQITTFGGGRERIDDGHGYTPRELTHEAATRELCEELSLQPNQIKKVKPLGYQSFNYEDNPDKGFSVHIAELKDGVTQEDMELTEGVGIIEGTLGEILDNPNVFGPIKEMLERNKERIEKWE